MLLAWLLYSKCGSHFVSRLYQSAIIEKIIPKTFLSAYFFA